MACRGVHFALTEEQLGRLLRATTDEKRLAFVEEIEEQWDEAYVQESDKAWDAIHRCLTDGTCRYDGGEYPLNLCVLGGQRLYRGDDYIICLIPAEDVPSLARALEAISQESLHERYFAIDPSDHGMPLSDDDFTYTWQWFCRLKDFFKRMASQNRAIIFTVDQ